MRPASVRDRSLRSRYVCAMVALLAVVAMSISGSALAATPSPGWMVRFAAEPTVFSHADNAACETEPTGTPPSSAPCDSYRLLVTNAGSRPTSGTITITDTLSSNVTAVFADGEEQQPGAATEALTCTTSPIRCTYAKPVPPDGQLIVTVNILVAPTSEATATSTATIEGGGAGTASSTESTKLNRSAPEKFGISDLVATAVGVDGAPDTLAGDHPYGFTTSFDFNNITTYEFEKRAYTHQSVQGAREIVVDLPPGFVGDPQAAARCPLSSLTVDSGVTYCPKASEVGVVTVGEGGGGLFRTSNVPGGYTTAIYNLVPEAGYPAEFGFTYHAQPIYLYPSVVPMKGFPGGYALQVRTPGLVNVAVDSISVTFFGDPAERDGEAAPLSAFFTNPVNCSAVPLKTRVEARPWEEAEGQPASEEEVAEATSYPQLTGCELLQFQPTIALTPETTEVDTPSGYVVEVAVPQSQNVSPVLATPELKDATVSLPPGVSVSPSAADGLASCSNAEIDLESTSPGSCPPQSKIGSVKIATPLLAEPLEGQVYVGEPECSPCEEADAQDGKMLRLFLQVQGSGVRVKLEGRVSTSSSSGGQLTTTFDNNPQLPFSTLRLTLNGGPWAPLANPQSCGSFQAVSDLSPWSAPITPDATPSTSIQIGGCGGPPSFAPSFEAGSERPSAGGSAPFNLSFSRSDGEQDLSAIQVHMPPGLLGMLSKVQLCPEPQAASGTCGPESRIGHSEVAAGAGQAPFWVRGEVFLTGPYDGAPFGLSVLTHAQAGPFNLGDVVVRAAVDVDPATSAITVTSGPLPQILDGVPLRIQKVEVAIDREGFMLNPTNCRVQQLTGKIASAQGAVSGVSTPFTVLGCANLPFKPTLTASAQGQGSKADGTRLSVKVGSPGLGQANVAKVDLRFPKAISSRLETLQHACPQSVFESNAADCDERSVIGTAIVHTPILSKPLIGPAYLVSHGGAAFPDVEFILQGEGITLILDGQTNIDNKTGITSSRFESVPDAPFTSFETILPTGPHSIFTANVAEKKNHNLCGENLQMPTTITAQNGDVIEQSTAIAIEGCGPSKGTSAKKPTRAQELASALKACRRKYGHARAKRATCEKQARRRYAAKTAARGKPSARPRGGKG